MPRQEMNIRMTGRLRMKPVNHNEVVERLAATPNEWGVVSDYRTKGVAASTGAHIRKANHKNFVIYQPANAHEIRITMSEEGWLLEARYVPAEDRIPVELSPGPHPGMEMTPARAAILRIVLDMKGSFSVRELMQVGGLKYSAVYNLLIQLTDRGLLTVKAEGRSSRGDKSHRHFYALNDTGREQIPLFLEGH